MPTQLPGTNDNGAKVKSDDFASYNILCVKIVTGPLGTDGQAVSSTNGLAINSNGDYITSSPLNAAQQTAVGTSVVNLPAQAATRRVVVKALNGNTGTIYVGLDNGVSTSSGFELGPGEAFEFPVNNANLIYLIASAAGQNVCWIAI